MISTQDDAKVHVFGSEADVSPPNPAERFMPFVRKGLANGITALSKINGGRSLSVEPIVRLLSLRFFARRFYGALIDANGASFSDVEETMGRIRSAKPEAWVREWRRVAERFDRLGRAAASKGRRASAVEFLTRASNYYRFAEMSLLVDSPDREVLQRASLDAYVLGGEFMDPPLERVCLRVNGFEAPAYLRVPRTREKPPVVLIAPGLGMVKEHGDFPSEVLLDRGIAAMVVDLPGQGESRRHFALNQANAVSIIKSAVDFLVAREDVDGSRLGVVGTSMGAAGAMLAAADDKRIRLVVEISGFYYPTNWWDRFPPDIKEFLRYVMGAKDQDELTDMIRPVSLKGRVGQIECPLLVVHGQRDTIIPFSESDHIWAEAVPPKERFIFPAGDHGCVNVGEARPLMGDWIAEKLGL